MMIVQPLLDDTLRHALLERAMGGDVDGRVDRPHAAVLIRDHDGHAYIISVTRRNTRAAHNDVRIDCHTVQSADAQWRRMALLDEFPSVVEALTGRRRASRPLGV